MTSLKSLDLGSNQLTSLTLPDGLTSLTQLTLWNNLSHEKLRIPFAFNLDQLVIHGLGEAKVTTYLSENLLVLRMDESDRISVIWSQGMLQSSETLTDDWMDLEDAESPLRIDTTRPMQFFRVKPE